MPVTVQSFFSAVSMARYSATKSKYDGLPAIQPTLSINSRRDSSHSVYFIGLLFIYLPIALVIACMALVYSGHCFSLKRGISSRIALVNFSSAASKSGADAISLAFALASLGLELVYSPVCVTMKSAEYSPLSPNVRCVAVFEQTICPLATHGPGVNSFLSVTTSPVYLLA